MRRYNKLAIPLQKEYFSLKAKKKTNKNKNQKQNKKLKQGKKQQNKTPRPVGEKKDY